VIWHVSYRRGEEMGFRAVPGRSNAINTACDFLDAATTFCESSRTIRWSKCRHRSLPLATASGKRRACNRRNRRLHRADLPAPRRWSPRNMRALIVHTSRKSFGAAPTRYLSEIHPSDRPRGPLTPGRKTDQALSRYPVRKIHHTAARHAARKTTVMPRLTATLTSATP